MPEIGDLLGAAARPPRAALDLERWARRATTLRRREQGVAAFAAVLAVVLPVSFLAERGADGESRLIPAPLGSHSAVPTASTHPAPTLSGPPAPVGSAPTGGGGAIPMTGVTVTIGPAVTSSPGAAPATEQPADPEFPLRETCSVSTLGAKPGEAATCRFSAAAAGGWAATIHNGAGYVNRVTTTVVVERGGHRYTYGDDHHCGTDLIRPGDHVTISITQTDVGYYDASLEAGAGYSC